MNRSGRFLLLVLAAAAMPACGQGYVFQAGAVQARGENKTGANAENYTRVFASAGRERDLGAGLPLVSVWLGFMGGSSRKVLLAPAYGPGSTGTYSPGTEGTLGLLLSNSGPFRFGGGLEFRAGTADVRYDNYGGDSGGSATKVHTDTWLLLTAEAQLGSGFSIFARAGQCGASSPRPSKEYGLGLRFRP